MTPEDGRRHLLQQAQNLFGSIPQLSRKKKYDFYRYDWDYEPADKSLVIRKSFRDSEGKTRNAGIIEYGIYSPGVVARREVDIKEDATKTAAISYFDKKTNIRVSYIPQVSGLIDIVVINEKDLKNIFPLARALYHRYEGIDHVDLSLGSGAELDRFYREKRAETEDPFNLLLFCGATIAFPVDGEDIQIIDRRGKYFGREADMGSFPSGKTAFPEKLSPFRIRVVKEDDYIAAEVLRFGKLETVFWVPEKFDFKAYHQQSLGQDWMNIRNTVMVDYETT